MAISGNIGIGTTNPGSLLDLVSGGNTVLTMGGWSTWTPSYSGFSTAPTVIARYIRIGKTIAATMRVTANGTSNATTLTFTLPVAAAVATTSIGSLIAVDNGSGLTTPCRLDTRAASTTADAYSNPAGGGWTAANGKDCSGTFIYEGE